MTKPMRTVNRQLITDTFKHPMMIVGLVLLLVPIAISVGFGGTARVFVGFGFLPLMMAGPGLAYAHRAETWVSTGIPRRTLLASGATIAAVYALFATLLMVAFGQYHATTLKAALSVVVSQDINNVVPSGASAEWAGIVAAYGLLTLTFQLLMSQATPALMERSGKTQFVITAVIVGLFVTYFLISKTVGELPAAVAVAVLASGVVWLLLRSNSGQSSATTNARSAYLSTSNSDSQQAAGEPVVWRNTMTWFTGTTKVVVLGVLFFVASVPLGFALQPVYTYSPNGITEDVSFHGATAQWGIQAIVAVGVGLIITYYEVGYGRTIGVAAGRTKRSVTLRVLLALAATAVAAFVASMAALPFASHSSLYLPCAIALCVMIGGIVTANLTVIFDVESKSYQAMFSGLNVMTMFPLAVGVTAACAADSETTAVVTLLLVAGVTLVLATSFYWLCTRREIIVHKVRS